VDDTDWAGAAFDRLNEESRVAEDTANGRDYHQAAVDFLGKCSLVPTPDAVEQLVEVFLPCLAIMCERGYDPDGNSWRDKGWRNQITEVMERADRLQFNVWQHGRRDENNARDIINYAAFLLRSDWDNEWGKFGPPGGSSAD
jgi:hypothetical protein